MNPWRTKALAITAFALATSSLGASAIAFSNSQVGPGWEVPSDCAPNVRGTTAVAFLLAVLSQWLWSRSRHGYRVDRPTHRMMITVHILSIAIPISAFAFADGLCGLQGRNWLSRFILMQGPWAILVLLVATIWYVIRAQAPERKI